MKEGKDTDGLLPILYVLKHNTEKSETELRRSTYCTRRCTSYVSHIRNTDRDTDDYFYKHDLQKSIPIITVSRETVWNPFRRLLIRTTIKKIFCIIWSTAWYDYTTYDRDYIHMYESVNEKYVGFYICNFKNRNRNSLSAY